MGKRTKERPKTGHWTKELVEAEMTKSQGAFKAAVALTVNPSTLHVWIREHHLKPVWRCELVPIDQAESTE